MVGKRRHVVENQAIVLGVELRRSIRASRAPRRAILVDQLAERCVIGSFLLCACPHERQQSASERQGHIEKPAPALHTPVVSIAHGCAHLGSPRKLETTDGTGTSKRVPHKLARFVRFCKAIFLAQSAFWGRCSPVRDCHLPVNPLSWPNPKPTPQKLP